MSVAAFLFLFFQIYSRAREMSRSCVKRILSDFYLNAKQLVNAGIDEKRTKSDYILVLDEEVNCPITRRCLTGFCHSLVADAKAAEADERWCSIEPVISLRSVMCRIKCRSRELPPQTKRLCIMSKEERSWRPTPQRLLSTAKLNFLAPHRYSAAP